MMTAMALNEDDDFSLFDATSNDSKWVEHIEDVLEDHADRWGFTAGKELSMGLSGYVVQATTSDGVAAVAKVRRPDLAMQAEVNALRLFDGKGVARLIAADEDAGILLVERVQPGTRMADTHSTDFGAAMADMLESLPIIDNDGSLVTLSERAERWAWNLDHFQEATPLSSRELRRAAQGLRELAASQKEEVLLHGNLHVANVLKCDARHWVAVDPKGFAGERLFEAAWWLGDPPTKMPEMVAPLQHRYDVLYERFDYDLDRVVRWAECTRTVVMASRVAAMMWADAERQADAIKALRTLA